MLNHDLTRRAKRADLALILQGMPRPAETQARQPVGKPVARVVTGGLKNVHLDQNEDVQAELLKRGWIDEEPVW